MKHLNNWRLFESEEVDQEEVAELIEQCKDIVETFNELEDKFRVAGYNSGFVKMDRYNDGSTRIGNFSTIQEHESDKAAIIFYLGLPEDLKGSYFKEYEESVTPEIIDELILLLSKSKNLVQRLSRYCDKIYYKLSGKSIKFILIFSNPDESGSKSTKVKRLYNKLKDFKDYDTWKTMNLVQFSPNNRFSERYKTLYDLIKNNPNLIDGRYGKWDEARRSNLQLRFTCSESIDEDTIVINVSGFKYKTYMMDRFKAIRLSNEEKKEAMICIEQKVKNSLRNDIDSIETSIEGNTIKVKVK